MVAVAQGSSLIGRFMRQIFSNIGQNLVGAGLLVGFILAGLVGIILLAVSALGKVRRFFDER